MFQPKAFVQGFAIPGFGLDDHTRLATCAQIGQ
jgi:hypothetical protein